MRITLAISALACFLLIGCSTPSETTEEASADSAPAVASFTDEDVQKIAADDRTFEEAFNAGDMETVASLYKDDAVVLAFGGAPVQGKENILAFFNTLPSVDGLSLITDQTVGFGDHVYQRGRIEMTIVMPDGTEVPFKGNFLVTRERQEDGQWLYTNDMFDEEASAE